MSDSIERRVRDGVIKMNDAMMDETAIEQKSEMDGATGHELLWAEIGISSRRARHRRNEIRTEPGQVRLQSDGIRGNSIGRHDAVEYAPTGGRYGPKIASPPEAMNSGMTTGGTR